MIEEKEKNREEGRRMRGGVVVHAAFITILFLLEHVVPREIQVHQSMGLTLDAGSADLTQCLVQSIHFAG